MEVVNENIEVKVEKVEVIQTPIISPVTKPEKIKKTRTEAQKNQLKLAREKRKEKTESKKRKLIQQVVTKELKDDSDDEQSNKRIKTSDPNDMKFSLKDSSWKWLALGGVTLAAGLSTSYIKSWDEYKPSEEKKEDSVKDVKQKPPQSNNKRDKERTDPLFSP
jgi:hypothetical protein